MLQSYKVAVHLILLSIYAFFLFFASDIDNVYYVPMAKTLDILSLVLVWAHVLLLVMAFFLKKKIIYFLMGIPIALQWILCFAFSDMGGRYYSAEFDTYAWWQPSYDGFYVMIVLYVLFMISLFVKIKDEGNIWDTLK